jgi:hypothetical protein
VEFRCFSHRQENRCSFSALSASLFAAYFSTVHDEKQMPRTRADSHLRLPSEPPNTFTFMIHHIDLYKLKPEVTPARVEEMMMNTRMQLLKIQEVLSIKCGKRIDPELPWPFFIAIDFESMDKYGIFREDPIHVKFMEEVIKPNTTDSLSLDFEMDPGKDVRFS